MHSADRFNFRTGITTSFSGRLQILFGARSPVQFSAAVLVFRWRSVQKNRPSSNQDHCVFTTGAVSIPCRVKVWSDGIPVPFQFADNLHDTKAFGVPV